MSAAVAAQRSGNTTSDSAGQANAVQDGAGRNGPGRNGPGQNDIDPADDPTSGPARPRPRSIPPLWLTVPARPGQLPGLRRALREWMSQAGIGEHDATSVQVAVGEATSNAVEHAYAGGEPGLVRLTARLDGDGVLSVQVIDQGRWRSDPEPEPPEPPRQRGRGFALMRATMDAVEVHRRAEGTTVGMRLTLDGGA